MNKKYHTLTMWRVNTRLWLHHPFKMVKPSFLQSQTRLKLEPSYPTIQSWLTHSRFQYFAGKVSTLEAMTTLNPCHLLSASTQLQVSAKLAIYNKPPNSIHGFKNGLPQFSEVHAFGRSVKPSRLFQNARYNISCAMNMTAGQSDDPGHIKFDHLTSKSRKLWESSPQPLKIFPWKRAGLNFIQLILDLLLEVVKYLCVPLLAVSTLSEMSYCAQERKLFFVPVPVIIGVAIAEVLKLAALEVSPVLKDAEVPWHLFVMAIFFTLLKLPGPYYPFWGRIIIPHIANGGLLRTLWFAFMWYKRPRKASTTASSHKTQSGSQSEPNEL